MPEAWDHFGSASTGRHDDLVPHARVKDHVVTRLATGAGTACLSTSEFLPAGQTAFGTLGRNSFYGPHFFDMDLSLSKDVAITEKVMFSFGAQAYNVLNHPNFDQPVADINNPTFGYIINPVGSPTSILGAFVGGNSSPRFIEIKGQLRF